MKRFAELYLELDESNRTQDKLEALKRYFREAPAKDAAWGLFFLSGQRIKRSVPTSLLRDWLVEKTGFPLGLVEECYEAVGDLSETLALLYPRSDASATQALHELVEQNLLPLPSAEIAEKKALVLAAWDSLGEHQRLVWNKLIMGNFRVGVARTLVIRALAEVSGVEPAIMAHRFMGEWRPSEEEFKRLTNEGGFSAAVAHPYPFYLAYPLDGLPSDLGPLNEWQAEWKWDGIRAQLIRREGQVVLWSRGEDLVTDRFPEVTSAARALPDGTVLDGEILAWNEGHAQGPRPMNFGSLQHRIGRKNVSEKMRKEIPVIFMVYDVLEYEGKDYRSMSLDERRAALEKISRGWPQPGVMRLSSIVQAASWDELTALQKEARQRSVEGLMLKRRSAAYGVGREKGDWWKWKIDPYHVDAVLMYAQRGHGRRANLYTDYTFGVWEGKNLVPVAKAYSGLTNEEIRKVDDWIRKHTAESFGPVRVVKHELVFELAFEGIQLSKRHKSGVAVRFPRMATWRKDKRPEDADTIETLKALISGPAPEVVIDQSLPLPLTSHLPSDKSA